MSFADFDAAILEFFNDFGFEATYIKQNGEGTYTNGENVIETVEIPVEAILLDLTLSSNGLSSKFGTEILAGDKELFIRPPEKTDSLRLPLEINTTTDKVRVNGVEYKIHTMKEINTTATEPLVYDLYIRR